MASVTFSNIWIHNASDLSDNIEVVYYTPIVERIDKGGYVERFAGGRKRAINRAGKTRQLNVNLTWVSRDDIAWLDNLAGELVMIRDNKGRLVFGTYQLVEVDDRRIYADGSVTLTIEEVTHSIGV